MSAPRYGWWAAAWGTVAVVLLLRGLAGFALWAAYKAGQNVVRREMRTPEGTEG